MKSLPTLPKKEPRPTAVTVRLSKQSVANLKMLADEHNMSQADVIEHLINEAATSYKENKKPKKKSSKKSNPLKRDPLEDLTTEELIQKLKDLSHNEK